MAIAPTASPVVMHDDDTDETVDESGCAGESSDVDDSNPAVEAQRLSSSSAGKLPDAHDSISAQDAGSLGIFATEQCALADRRFGAAGRSGVANSGWFERTWRRILCRVVNPSPQCTHR